MPAAKERKTAENGDTYVVASVDRALQLLIALAEMPHSGVTELAKATGTTKSLTFRLLYTLERRGLVRKDQERRTYAIGYRALLLGDQSRRQSHLITAAEPVLSDLAEQTRENALLLVREGRNSVCIALRDSPHPLRVFAARGRVGPLHAGGGPKVLLAYAPEAVLEDVLTGERDMFTEMTVPDGETLKTSLENIRRDGFAVSMGEIDPNTFSIAAPVRDHSGDVIAALGVNGPTARLDDTARVAVRDAVLAGAAQLSTVLGWRGERMSSHA